MKNNIFHIFILNLSSFLISTLVTAQSTKTKNKYHQIQLGPRPYYLIDNMESSTLKESLKKCSKGPFKATDFSIGHRGAPLQFPEHTEESYRAAARMGAGILECDVTFTKDKKLVCRHSQCDLHTTTNILAIPQLASKCSEPFSPANPKRGKKASAKCCTSDITLSDFKKLCGKMDSFNPDALTVDEYLKGTEKWRTDLYSTCGKLLSHKESIELFSELGVKFTPELKEPAVSMPFQGSYSQKDYAKSMIDEYKAAKIDPNKVFPQSFNLEDVLYWISNEPDFGKQAVYLDSRVYTKGGYDNAVKNMSKLSSKGVKIIAPPLYALVKLDKRNKIIPSEYAIEARSKNLKIITWTLERSGPLSTGGGWYYQSIKNVIKRDGDAYTLLDILAKDVGIAGIFSDWPATVTYYANCMSL